MLLGKIVGKVTTRECKFSVDQETSTFEYVKILHPSQDWVLGQVTEIEATTDGKVATCNLIGYHDGRRVKQLRAPLEPGTEVFRADDDFIKKIIALPDTNSGAYVGKLENRDIRIRLDLKRLLTKHVSVLAKSGAGKSYVVGVLAEEILERNVPIVIIDPHGEYHTLKRSAEPDERLARFGLKPKAYSITEYGNATLTEANPLALSNRVSRADLTQMLPKLNTTQQGILYSAIRNAEHTDFDQLLAALEAEESMAKWSLINLIESLRNYQIFSSTPTPPKKLVRAGSATIINLKGYPPDIQELIVYKLAKDLFELRKKNTIPPFFLVVEEAHNFCPERAFGEASCSKILRTIASEGRKFGMGLCVISQRPARVDKSVLSQCTTQIVLKVTNPHDLRAIGSSVEGLTAETEKEIRNLPIGTALVTGVVDLPLIVSVRPRRTAHGGDAVDILNHVSENEGEVMPLIYPTTSKKDMEVMSDSGAVIQTLLRPVLRAVCADRKGDDKDSYVILIDLTNGEVITSIDEFSSKKLPNMASLNQDARDALKYLLRNKRLNPEELGIAPETMEALQSSGFVLASGGVFKLSDAYLYTRLRTVATNRPMQFEAIDEDARLEGRYTPQQVSLLLGRFAKVLEKQECWLVQYVKK